MVSGHHGITNFGMNNFTATGCALLLLLLQGGPLAAEGSSDASEQAATSSAVDPAGPFGFLDADGNLLDSPDPAVSRAGYVTVIWSEYPGAWSYRLVNREQTELYRGAFTQAFVSGLPDGRYAFTVMALDRSGKVLAETEEPFTVSVEHWPLSQAWLLFGTGLIVFVCLVLVIVRGAVQAGESALEAEPLSPNNPTETA